MSSYISFNQRKITTCKYGIKVVFTFKKKGKRKGKARARKDLGSLAEGIAVVSAAAP